ncbi:MAG TPA: ATP-binding protein [Opitutaceae bacterium]|nr:ATP-binding protein [Opitutaceae bacterium]
MKLSESRPALVCAAYFALHLAAQLSARLFEITPGISVWYPPCGLALSLLVMLGPRYALVVFAANVAGAFVVPGFPRWWAPLVFPALITANYAGVAWLVRRFFGGDLLPGSTGRTVALAGVLLGAPLPAAVVGTELIRIIHANLSPAFLLTASQWWLGDVTGLLTIVPAVMVFVAPWLERKPHPLQDWHWSGRLSFGFVAHALALVAALCLVFAPLHVLPNSALYICFVPLTWTCLRYGLPGATLATVLLTMGTLIGMHLSPANQESSLLSFLLFATVLSVLGLGLGSAVTHRNQALAELSTSRARFDRVIAGARLGLWDWNIATGSVVYNRHCAELLHRKDRPLATTPAAWNETIHPADRQRVESALQAHLRADSPLYEAEYRVRTDDGRWRWVHSRGSVVQRDEGGNPLLVSGTHLDITDRKVVEAAAHRLLTIVETTTDFVVTIDERGQIVYVNQSTLALLGLPDRAALEGQPFRSIFTIRSGVVLQTEIIPRAIAHGACQGELALKDKDQREIPTSFVALVHPEAEGEGSLLSLVMRDISAQKRAEAAKLDDERRILQVQKAESLSVLAGGIAHDFNNLLTAISGNAALLREDLGLPEEQHGPLTQIEIAATRAADLCRNMLAYAGRFQLTLAEVSLNALVEESRELVHAAVSRKITIETNLAPNLPPIKGAASQLQQVVINLALNAHEAIGDEAGRITLRTRYEEYGNSPNEPRLDAMPPGQYVVLEIEDTGCGIPEDLRTKIFEPFFTTKPHGHGLGLSAVKGIIRAHGGAIRISDARPRGTLFRIWLPAVKTVPAPAAVPAAGTAPWQGSGLALIVDDEAIVRTVIARLVERLGFTTITAGDGVEAVELFHKHHQDLRFVLTDLTMPRMSGDEAIIEMRRINPNVPALLMSGYPEKMTANNFVLASPSALLIKPLPLPVLQKTLSQVVPCS